VPEEGSLDWKILTDAEIIRKKWAAEGLQTLIEKPSERIKRELPPATTYTAEIYMVVDYALYQRLVIESWAGTRKSTSMLERGYLNG